MDHYLCDSKYSRHADQRNVGFVDVCMLTHGIVDLFKGRSSKTGGSAV